MKTLWSQIWADFRQLHLPEEIQGHYEKYKLEYDDLQSLESPYLIENGKKNNTLKH